MPQRRKPFSGKKKKDQLMQKRHTKGQQHYNKVTSDDDDETEKISKKLMEQRPGLSGRNRNTNRYNLQFYQESKKELEQMKQEGFKPLIPAEPKQRELNAGYFEGYDFPIRPKWSYGMSLDALERNEHTYFREYVEELKKNHREENKEFSLFELNLETWRQLWRVLELSDILLIIVDVRYSTLMFPPSLYKYIVNTVKKHAILVLNKVDLVTPEAIVAWRHYFQETYPGLPIVLFASYPAKALKGTAKRRKGHKRCMEGVYNIYRECKKIVQSEIDITNWEQKILEDLKDENISFDDEPNPTTEIETKITETHPSQETSHGMFQNGILTVGCIGFPNVGKSSLINALKGRKVVSVSRTPGHTKHFQTIFLTNVVRLCDCPGLVFPSSTPKYLQVLLGSYPISQLQVPYISLKFLAEHINLPQLLKIRLPEDYEEWSAAAISDAWALKRGFLTAKAARPDRYRAANHLLRMCLAGQQQIILQFYPPGFEEQKEKWRNHAEIAEVKKYQDTDNEDEDENNDEVSSVNSETEDSPEGSSSNDETNADEEEEKIPKSRNPFDLLEDD